MTEAAATSHFNDFRQVLRAQLESRCQRNLRYSLRSFARDLGLSPARLSEVLKGKQGLSLKWASHVADRLGFAGAEKQHFCDLVESRHARNQARRELAKRRLAESAAAPRNQLSLDAFQTVSDWYHFAILSLAELADFQSEPQWIATRLGIPLVLVEPAIERLIRLEQLERDSAGRLRVVTEATFAGSGVPSMALKNFHRQILERAAVALFEQDVHSRDFNSGFVAIPKARVPEAKKLLEEMRTKFWNQITATAPSDSVYCLTMGFFRIDQGEV